MAYDEKLIRRLVAYIPRELYAKLQESAQENVRSVSAEVQYVLKQYYQALEKAEAEKDE